MAGESGKSSVNRIVYRYYKCSGAKRHLGCKRKPLRKDWIERVAVLLTVNKVLTDSTIDRIADAIVAMQNEEDTMISDIQTGEADEDRRRAKELRRIRLVMRSLKPQLIVEYSAGTAWVLRQIVNQKAQAAGFSGLRGFSSFSCR